MKEKTEAKNALHDAEHAKHVHVHVPEHKLEPNIANQSETAQRDVEASMPSAGSDNRADQGSQSGGAGSGIPRREVSTKKPNPIIQHSRDEQARREMGGEDTTKSKPSTRDN